MKNVRIIAAVIAALVVIVISVFGISQQRAAESANAPKVESKQVVVAVKDIDAYTVITQDMVQVEDVAITSALTGSYDSVDAVVGSTTIGNIVSGEILLSNHIRASEEGETLTAPVLEDGYRAVTVQVEESTGVANLLKVGNNVDVILTATDPDHTSFTKSVMLFENIEVIALDQTLTDKPKSSDSSDSDSEEATSYVTVTLKLKPQQTLDFAAARSQGSLCLSLRPQDDDSKIGKDSSSTFNIL